MEVTKSIKIKKEYIPPEEQPSPVPVLVPTRQWSTALHCFVEVEPQPSIISGSLISTIIREFKEAKDDEFDELVEKYQEQLMNNSNLVLDLYEKAIDDDNLEFFAAYAKMVGYFGRQSQEAARKFRKQVLDTCQKKFQASVIEDEAINRLENELAEVEDGKQQQQQESLKAELEEKRSMARRRALGNIHFIGELFKAQVLTTKIMVDCIATLLASGSEENYECLCKLLTIIGQKLEVQLVEAEIRAIDLRRRGVVPLFTPDPNFMEKTFAKLRCIYKDKKFFSGIRYALMDVYDLRQNGWKAKPRRRDASGPGPSVIHEVHHPRGEKRPLQKLQNLTPAPSPFGREDDQPSPQKKKKEWNTVSPAKSSRFAATKKPIEPAADNSGLPIFMPQEGSFSNRPIINLHIKEEKVSPLERSSDEDRQVIKNVHEKFFNVMKKLDNTLEWIQSRFNGQRMHGFIDELSRMVCDMPEEEQQKTAGTLFNTLIKKGLVNRDEVIKTLKDGVITELADIEIRVPQATSYLSVFLVELFLDEPNLEWLLEFESRLKDSPATWTNLTTQTLNTLKLRRSEEAVQHLIKQTKGANRLPIQDIPWIARETFESLKK